MSDAQSLIDGILLEAGVQKTSAFDLSAIGIGVGLMNGKQKDEMAAKILDLYARMPVSFKEGPSEILGASGQFAPPKNQVTVDAQKSSNAGFTTIHEAVHAIEHNVIRPAMEDGALTDAKSLKFKTLAAKVLDKYGKDEQLVLQNPNVDATTAYKADPSERLAFGTDMLNVYKQFKPAKELAQNQMALRDLMQLIDLVPDKYKQTPKQKMQGPYQ